MEKLVVEPVCPSRAVSIIFALLLDNDYNSRVTEIYRFICAFVVPEIAKLASKAAK